MDKEQNVIPSSETSEAEPLSSNTDEISEEITSSEVESDCRIHCTDNQSLRNILDVTLDQIKGLADSCNLGDSHKDFMSVFSESFKNALQENVLVNGLPLIIDESKKLSSPEKEDHLHMVDDVLFGKLSKKVAEVARKRKIFPDSCSRILKQDMKHDIQNLKRSKISDSSVSSTSYRSSKKLPSKDRTQLKHFSEFCQGFGTMQETVQCKIQEKEKLAMKLSLVQEIHKKQKLK